MSIIIGTLILTLFSILSLWKPNPVLFMINAGISILVGLVIYNYMETPLGLGLSLIIGIAYTIYNIAMAYRMFFWKEPQDED